MAGRLITLQTHPRECPTDYAALIAMRCDIVQDLRMVPPPKFSMLPDELEQEVSSAQTRRDLALERELEPGSWSSCLSL